MRARCAHDPGLVSVGSKARIGARDIVGDNGVTTLAGELTLRVLHDVIGLGRKADHAPLSLLTRKLSQDVNGLDQFNSIQGLVGLFELMVRWGRWSVVGDGGGANGHVGRLEGARRRLQHLCGGLHAYARHAAGNIERCRSQHRA